MQQQIESLQQTAFLANMLLPKHGLVIFTWGNVSAVNRELGLVAIKASGVPYDTMTPDDMAVLDLNGKLLTPNLRPSSDTDTHLALYSQFPNIGGIVHTHSRWATAWAQAGRGIPCFGTTHADDFYGEIPCTRAMTPSETAGRYEWETGQVIVETFQDRDPDMIPAVLVSGHGPFAWGTDALAAVQKAVILEEVARMAHATLMLQPDAQPISQHLLDRHYLRKHGAGAYYGQR